MAIILESWDPGIERAQEVMVSFKEHAWHLSLDYEGFRVWWERRRRVNRVIPSV